MNFFISDTHFMHNKDFVYAARGFKDIKEHDEAIIRNWNSVVTNKDTVFVLGDFALGQDTETIAEYIDRLNGEYIYLIKGNHDTDNKWRFYKQETDIYCIGLAYSQKLGKNNIYMSHFPTFINDPSYKSLDKAVINLFGHTHSKDKFFSMGGVINPYMYNVACDAHNCTPVSWEQIYDDIKKAL